MNEIYACILVCSYVFLSIILFCLVTEFIFFCRLRKVLV